jgi:cysteine desulfurase/selenocysteine lyase
MSGWRDIRDDFPVLRQLVGGKPLVYLDNAATTQKPRAVIEAVSGFYERDNANVHRGLHALSMRATEAYEAARAAAARFINAAAPEEIVFTRGTTESVNLVAHAWGAANVRAGDVILATEMEHHSNLVPWQLLAERTGATLKVAPVAGADAEGGLDLDALDKLLSEGARLLAFTHISNTLGTVNDVAALCARARKAGAVTVVDAAQSAGHEVVDVRKWGCDFAAFSGHKMLGPTGVGVLYGRRGLLDKLPPFNAGGGMVATVEYGRATFKPPPERFEAGTPDICGAVGLRAAMDYLDGLGRGAVAAHDRGLARLAAEAIAAIPGARLIGPRPGAERGGLVSFALREAHAHDVVTFLDRDGIAVRGGHHCNQPLMRKLGLASTVRASFSVYNTEEEVAALARGVERIRRFFA